MDDDEKAERARARKKEAKREKNRIAHRIAQGLPPEIAVELTAKPVPRKVVVPIYPVPTASGEGLDFPEQVEALREVVTDNLNLVRYLTADRADTEETISAQKIYGSSLETLRKSEGDLCDLLEARGKLVSRAAVAMELAEIIGAIHTAVGRLVLTTRPKLKGESIEQQDEIWAAEVRQCFKILTNSNFASAMEAVPCL